MSDIGLNRTIRKQRFRLETCLEENQVKILRFCRQITICTEATNNHRRLIGIDKFFGAVSVAYNLAEFDSNTPRGSSNLENYLLDNLFGIRDISKIIPQK